MKLFIASTFADTVKLFKQHVSRGKVLFIANASDLFKNKYWIKKDLKAFEDNGFPCDEFDLRQTDVKDFAQALKETDIVHFCGGSAIYLLKLLKERRLDYPLIQAVTGGRIIYTGTSAGSMIAGPDISILKEDPDEREVAMNSKLKDYTGLGLVPYMIFCHSQEKYYVKATQQAMKSLPKNKTPILMLNDNQSVWHENGSMKIETLE